MAQRKESTTALAQVRSYVNNGLMAQFDELPTVVKLAVTQAVPPKWIAERDIGGKSVQYLPGWVSQRILNFIFNFNISTKILEQKVNTYTQTTRFYDKKKNAWGSKESVVNEATVHAFFKFTSKEGMIVEREYISTHKAFENAAVAKDDCLKGAISKAWTLAAHSFGIASNVKGQLHPEAEPPKAEEVQEEQAAHEADALDLSTLPY